MKAHQNGVEWEHPPPTAADGEIGGEGDAVLDLGRKWEQFFRKVWA